MPVGEGFSGSAGLSPDCNGATVLRRWETSQAALLMPLTDSSSMGPVDESGIAVDLKEDEVLKSLQLNYNSKAGFSGEA